MACATLHGMDTYYDHLDNNLRAWQDSAVIEHNIRQLNNSDKPTARTVFKNLFNASQIVECECIETQCPLCIGRAEAELDILAETLTEE